MHRVIVFFSTYHERSVVDFSLMMSAPLPRFRIYTSPKTYWTVFRELVTGKTDHGNSVREFEKAIEDTYGYKHAIAMPTARTAIYYTIKNTIKPGQKVILSPITISDVINMVICAGGVPVFADVERKTCNIDPKDLETLLDDQTGAVLITHLHGLACDMEKIVALCKSKNVPLIEDSAQAFSSRFQGKYVSSFGRAGIFSFGMYKNVNAFFGGMVVTSDDALAETLRKETASLPFQDRTIQLKKIFHAFTTDLSTMPALFKAFTYWVFRFAYLNRIEKINNITIVDRLPERKDSIPSSYLSRMRPMQARICLDQLSNVENNNRMRIRAARIYNEGLKDIAELILPPFREDGSHLYTYYPIQYHDRHALMRFAMEHKRDLVLSHYHNCANLECFSKYYRNCPNATETSKDLIYLPTYPRYTLAEIHENVRVIRAFFEQNKTT